MSGVKNQVWGSVKYNRTHRPKTHKITINTSEAVYNIIKSMADERQDSPSSVALGLVLSGLPKSNKKLDNIFSDEWLKRKAISDKMSDIARGI